MSASARAHLQGRFKLDTHEKGGRPVINPNEYRIDARGSSGVTVTHLPSGTTASVDATSQHMSRHIAMEMVQCALRYTNRLRSKEKKDG